MTAAFVIPAPLAPGDMIAVVAPSGRFRADDLWRGLAWLRARYVVRLRPGVLDRDGYLAGTDERRRDELVRALGDPEVKAIVAVRGGFGASRVCDDLPWDVLARHPRWIVGFSDVTALHVMAWRAGVASVHGPTVTGLAPQIPVVRDAWLSALERPRTPRAWSGLRVLRRGEARGPIVGGNLALLHAMAAAGRLVVPEGAVLAMEDVTEAPYRVDRMLTSLLVGGHLSRASAIVFGAFERCEPGPDGRTVGEVLEERTRSLGIPVVAGAPFGHAPHNEAFVLGAPAHVQGDTVILSAQQNRKA
jgi:muramoyltetrapeptide carboxypeptidase